MSTLISGKEALIALANGDDVEFYIANQWHSLAHSRVPAKNILEDNYQFRLKPRTITINGIEVPSPQKDIPERGDDVFTLDFTNNYGGFTSWKCQHSINTFSYEWWRTEEEIKQVVAALRKVFEVQQ